MTYSYPQHLTPGPHYMRITDHVLCSMLLGNAYVYWCRSLLHVHRPGSCANFPHSEMGLEQLRSANVIDGPIMAVGIV